MSDHAGVGRAYIFSIDAEGAGNWEICKSAGVIGVRTSAQGQASARAIREGDVVFVWRAGGSRRAGSGLIARLTVAGPARPASLTTVPWPEPEKFTFVIPVVLDEELEGAVPDRFPNNQESERFKIQNSALQKGLMPVSGESSDALEACFSPRSTSGSGEAGPVAVDGGWSTDQDLIREVEQAAVAVVRAHLSAAGWREVRDCQRDGCGYDFLYVTDDGSERLVEVKGTTSSDLRFRLTRLEQEVLSADPRGRIYVVTEVLTAPSVHALDWFDLEDLGVKPISWQVGW